MRFTPALKGAKLIFILSLLNTRLSDLKVNTGMADSFRSVLILLISLIGWSCSPKVNQVHIANGWAQNTVNTTAFRSYSLYTFGDQQFTAFYDGNKQLILGKRTLGTSAWNLKRTPFSGNALDAHNGISIIVDYLGYLHVSWDHHNSPLRYARSNEPLSLELTNELPMIGDDEQVVSYPQFYTLGNELLFFYRSGGSGNGDLFINKYNPDSQQWTRLQSNLISGEGQRNAYWQACIDQNGTIHISWVWRESPDLASNHDLCYASSVDGGHTWTRSNGAVYNLPITAENAEYAVKIPQNSELINQTAMTSDNDGRPVIATYWRPEGSKVPQYHLIYQSPEGWKTQNLDFRKEAFSLSGRGTKAIPIARPQLVVGRQNDVHLIFRDAERGNKVSIASSQLPECKKWKIHDLTEKSYNSWEPTLDPVMWQQNKELHLFLQNVTQVDGEGISQIAPQPIKVLEWKR